VVLAARSRPLTKMIMPNPDLSIIIVSWNVAGLLRANLASLPMAAAGLAAEIFVVDNHSSDNTVDLIKTEFPDVRLIANQENLGFARANNLAIRASRGRYVLLLNPDMRVRSGALKKMLDWLDQHPAAGVAGGRLLDAQGRNLPHVRRWPTLWDQSLIILKLPHLWPSLLDSYLCPDFDYSQAAPVDSVRGSFFFIRRELIDKLGGLDERYFLWFEEVDFCKRAQQKNWPIVYNSSCEIMHKQGQSFKKVKATKEQYLFNRSLFHYFRKHCSKWEYAILLVFYPLSMFSAFLVELLESIKSSEE